MVGFRETLTGVYSAASLVERGIMALQKHQQSRPLLEEYVNIQVFGRGCSVDPPIPGRNFAFCSSVPNSLIGCIVREDWTEEVERYPESTLRKR